MQSHTIVSQAEWARSRLALLAKEKAHMSDGDRLSAERRALPWVKVGKTYVFDTEAGPKGLADLFDGQEQLILHHLMFAPEWDAGCPGCSFQAEHIDGPSRHLARHNTKILAASRAPLSKLLAYRQRMGWRFDWVSSFGTDFNYDFRGSFKPEEFATGSVAHNFNSNTADPRYVGEELPGLSVFRKDAEGTIFRTYSTYARGLDTLIGTHHYLDLTPEGRNESRYPDWPRRHDEYDVAAPANDYAATSDVGRDMDGADMR